MSQKILAFALVVLASLASLAGGCAKSYPHLREGKDAKTYALYTCSGGANCTWRACNYLPDGSLDCNMATEVPQ